MQTWWDESIEKYMIPDGYRKVTVLLLKWKDELDELNVRQEAS